MNDDKVIYLVDIRDELQSFMHYPDLNTAWEKAWELWKAYNIRHRFRSGMFFNRAEKDGYIARKDAESLCLFLHKTHFWKCLK